jgi:DNA-binding MarR family transcriptional regulator
MAPSGLRITQFALLRTVARAGSAKITDLASRLSLDRTALRRNLRPLEQKGSLRVVRGRDRRVRAEGSGVTRVARRRSRR